MNKPDRKPWLPIVAALCALAAILVFVWAVGPDHEPARAVPSELDSAEKPAERMAATTIPERSAIRSEAPGSAEPTDVADGPRPNVATRRETLWNALQELGLDANFFRPWSLHHDFSDHDMEPIRRVIARLHVSGSELRDLLADPSPDRRPLRAVVLASFAFASGVDESHHDVVVDAARASNPTPGSTFNSVTGQERVAEAYAAGFALHMLDAQPQLADAARHFLGLYELEDRERMSDSRNLAGFMLGCLEGALDTELLAATRRIVAGEASFLTVHAFSALARGGTPEDRQRLIEMAKRAIGPSRIVLEKIEDPGLAGELESIADGSGSAVGSNIAGSAAVGLLSIGTPRTLEAFDRLAASPNGAHDRTIAEALTRGVPIEATGTIFKSWAASTRSEVRLGLTMMLDEALTRMRDQVAHSAVPPRKLDECMRGVRQALPVLASNPKALARAFEVLSLGVDEPTWSDLAPELSALPPGDVARLERIRAERR